MERQPEAWLRGPLQGVHPAIAPLLRTLEQVREDVPAITAGLTEEQVWARPNGIAALGFHLRHIGGSTDRLLTYAERKQLSDEQMAALKNETQPGATLEELIRRLDEALGHAADRIRRIDPNDLHAGRVIGRQELPTTVIGILIHIAEHSLRHLGQAVTTAKIVRGGR